MQDYHVRGSHGTPSHPGVAPAPRETFVCGIAALSKKDAAGYVIDRLNDDGGQDMDVQVSASLALPGKSTLAYGRPIFYGAS